MTRTDTTLIKYLAKNINIEAAGVYNQLPLFLMPEESNDLLQNEGNIMEAAPDILPYPFDDFLIDFPYGTGAVNKT